MFVDREPTGTLQKVGAIVYECTLRPADKVIEPWLERCRAQAEGGLAALEPPPAMAGTWAPCRGQPDVTVACMLAYLPLRAPELFRSGRYPRLEQLLATAEALPAFQQTRPATGEVMPTGL